MRHYYSEEEELKYGVLGIAVELIDQESDCCDMSIDLENN